MSRPVRPGTIGRIEQLWMKNESPQHYSGGCTCAVIKPAVQHDPAADAGAVGKAEIIPFSLGRPIASLSQSGGIYIIDHCRGYAETVFEKSFHIRSCIAGDVVVCVTDGSILWINLPRSADTNSLKRPKTFQKRGRLFQQMEGPLLCL